MQPLKSIDLFSGIGGMTLALNGYAAPIAYCDIAVDSRQVLANNMHLGHIATAPISQDISSFNKLWVERMGIQENPEMIVAGSPCVGFSTIGQKQGFLNEQSALFYELLRVVDEFASVKVLFLENVPNILNLGMDIVIDELCTKRHFSMRWTCVSACELKAPHKRMRWYAICTRENVDVNNIFTKKEPVTPAYPWTGEGTEPERMTLDPSPDIRKRMACLGNSVVPCAARHAFEYIAFHIEQDKKRAVAIPDQCWPKHGMFVAGRLYSVERNVDYEVHDFKLVLDPKSYVSPVPQSELLSTGVVSAPIARKLWGTPVKSNVGAARFLSVRCAQPLSTQIRFEKSTPDHLRGGWTEPRFVEWIMGYPLDWTCLTPLVEIPLIETPTPPRKRSLPIVTNRTDAPIVLSNDAIDRVCTQDTQSITQVPQVPTEVPKHNTVVPKSPPPVNNNDANAVNITSDFIDNLPSHISKVSPPRGTSNAIVPIPSSKPIMRHTPMHPVYADDTSLHDKCSIDFSGFSLKLGGGASCTMTFTVNPKP